jgi:integrase
VRHELVYLDTAALRRLLDALEDDPLGPLVTVAAMTGLRQGELLGLRWQDVDIDGRQLTVRRAMALTSDGSYALAEPKTAKSRRTINLPARAVAALVVERERQDARREALGAADWQDRLGLVFTDAAGRPRRGDSVTHAFQQRLQALGLPRVPFHALRHSCATALLAAGVPLKVVSETLGHSTITIAADTYAHVAPELRRDAADALDRALG